MIRPLSILVALAVVGAFPAAASAGTYTVTACFGDGVNRSWDSFASNGFAYAFSSCGLVQGEVEPGLVARNTGGPGIAPYFSHARMTFQAPPGARIVYMEGGTKQYSAEGWQAGIHDETANTWVSCCNNLMTWQPFHLNLSTYRVAALVMCVPQAGCRRDAQHGYVALRNVRVTIAEDGLPNVAITGGSLVAGGWRRGVQDVTTATSDSVGVKQVDVLIDGGLQRRKVEECEPTLLVPCPSQSPGFSFDTRTLADGRHTLSVRAFDSARNLRMVSRAIAVDNTPPGSPQVLAADGGSGWKGRNQFRLTWRNPLERHAPIEGATVAVCPALPRLADPTQCSHHFYRTNSGATPSIQVPGRGEWRAYVWLRDAAGNEAPSYAAETILRFDDAPPSVSIRPEETDHPAVVRVRSGDSLSPLAVREVFLRRRGQREWLSLPVTPNREGFTAFVDDEQLADGVYELRARAVDQAGNERSTDRREDGALAQLALPLRIKTRLAVGRPKRVRARGSRGKRRYRIVLIAKPQSRYGRTIPLRGRLTSPGGNPLVGREVEVSEQTKIPGAPWRPIATLRTTRTGRFTFKALRGPSRTLRFRFDGGDTIRGRTALVRLRVQAATSIRASRGRVVNGEDVTFRGRLRGTPIPSTGKLVELQARTRGGWRTFATSRARARNGRWSYTYRFSATRGSVRYRFRARVPKEAGFPYETGASRQVSVRVRGL